MRAPKTIAGGVLLLLAFLAGCTSAADTANDNLNKAADNFEVPRRITAINGITDKVLFTVEGFCSVSTPNGDFFVTCKLPDGSVQRTSMVLSDNVTAVVSQIGGTHVDLFRPRVIFRPETIVPDFDLSTSAGS